MKKIISLLLTMVLLVASTTVLATAEVADTEYDLTIFHWGDSMETVKAVEGEPVAQLDDSMKYEKSVFGMNMEVWYLFEDNGSEMGLWMVLCGSNETHNDHSLYIADYEKLKEAMTREYGEPFMDKEAWEDDSKKASYADKKGDALYYGYVTYGTMWEFGETGMMMTLSMDFEDNEISMVALYMGYET